MPAQCLTMIEVSIPSLERAVDESGKLRKLFRVEILFNGRKHFVLKRHTEFQNLHRKLKKILQTPDFPSKRSPHLRQKPLEQRRQELEDYIQDILYLNEEVPQEILDFLQVKHFHSVNKICSFESLDDSQTRDFRTRIISCTAFPGLSTQFFLRVQTVSYYTSVWWASRRTPTFWTQILISQMSLSMVCSRACTRGTSGSASLTAPSQTALKEVLLPQPPGTQAKVTSLNFQRQTERNSVHFGGSSIFEDHLTFATTHLF
ncbi:sorting nexin-22 isoform X1 [Anguilla rostrata]|uniref:sorting nexin-22 isoform X1 n=1 Tax=Anguilla rostrata TaxID=7938 RepID=UPI0030D156C6